MNNTAIILCGGSNRRMGTSVADKNLVPIEGKCALIRVLEAFIQSNMVANAIIVFRSEAQKESILNLLKKQPVSLPLQWVRGGAERHLSVAAALDSLPENTDLVFIHDCARPLITAESIREVGSLATQHGAATLARSVTDTIKSIRPHPEAPLFQLKDLARAELRSMETPQVFQSALILKAYENREILITDDTAAVAALGHPVALYEPNHPNPKITHPDDLAWIKFLLNASKPIP